jgi:hypothetical protein
MELIRYLEAFFWTREQLLAHCAIGAGQLAQLQRKRMMPQPSYRLRLDLGCQSFFGEHAEQVVADYYARGYASWLGVVSALEREDEARTLFFRRYRAQIAQLGEGGLLPRDPTFAGTQHLGNEWQGFLDGTYGLCTVSGLPEDIAAKEAATALIRELSGSGETPDDGARALLRRAVDLLDRSAARFAPHEVERSSRRRYVDTMRVAHGFMPPASASPSTGQPCLRSRCPAGRAS